MDPIARMVAAGAAGASGGDPTYVDDVYSTFVYEGNASTQAINNGIDLSSEGGLVWMKERQGSGFDDHILVDTERGRLKAIRTALTNGEASSSDPYPYISSFNTNGFTAGYNNSNNYNAADYVSWTFRKAPGFFDVVTYTGNGGTQNISHSLGSEPGMMLIKRTDSTDFWTVYHRSLGNDYALNLSDTAGGSRYGTSEFNNTTPTSTEFTVATSDANANGGTYVAYIFAHDDQSFGTNSDESIIKCGSYTGSGSDGNFVNVGFEPQWLMIKNTNSDSTNWLITDVMRGMPASGGTTKVLFANTTSTETTQVNIAPNPTGFTLAGSGSYSNQSGNTFIYMAIRRPHKPPTAGTEVFKSVQTTSQTVSVDFPTDLIVTAETGSGAKYWVPRLTNARLQSSDTSSENDMSSYFEFDLQNSFSTGSWWGGAQTINYYFKRAPGFFDVVAYTGNGSARTIPHNLGATPSVVLIKGRDTGYSWYWQHYALGANATLQLNNNEVQISHGQVFNSTLPTSSVFSIGSLAGGNSNGDPHVAFLFGDLDGISKAGTYTGTGSNVNVDCGFTAGARFVIIKRADAAGDWYVWDSTRGIVSGNDPYLILNSTSAQTTNTDYIDPLNAGFTVTSSAINDLNANGGTYAFLAIA